eukprot:Hpha_TRINITY_DN27489_c0_g1::TRINITY_DN27489_c0_g1_i1::g.193895::m.193895
MPGGCPGYQPDPERIPEGDWRRGLKGADWDPVYFDEGDLCLACGQNPVAHATRPEEEEATVVSAVHLAEHEEEEDSRERRTRVRTVVVEMRVLDRPRYPVAASGHACAFPNTLLKCPAETAPLEKALGRDFLRRCLRSAPDVPTSSAGTTVKSASLKLLYKAGTSFSDVGLQIWRCSFLLTDYIAAWLPALLPSSGVVLELGAGVGLCGLAAAAAGADVWLTDSNEAVLDNLEETVRVNALSDRVSVKRLDLLWEGIDGAKGALEQGGRGWREEDVGTTVDLIVAADVVFNNEVTEGFVSFLRRHFAGAAPAQACVLATDRRVGQYLDRGQQHPLDYFLECSALAGLSAQPIDLRHVPQTVLYDRTPELQLWWVQPGR